MVVVVVIDYLAGLGVGMDTEGWQMFRGIGELDDFARALEEYGKMTCSPSEAAVMLGVTRQRLHTLIGKGRFQVWAWSESGDRWDLMRLAVDDVITEQRKRGIPVASSAGGLTA